ncbi:hypothetical protein KM924_22335 [Brevibacillus parabrevis]|uniref:hypothetical protein n=1 Tax=Brevibacillus parabrevis TaxID=54914 RepID=UPI001C2417BC|nr:hypothetical protein [Brevibacillus parabrevis]MBU8715247.1 hypothetical protein [Brevibacillus parabrevis]
MISIFLSYPQPHKIEQKEFIDGFIDFLKQKDISPRTLGVTDYDNHAPLAAIRRLMLESDGFITVAFRRTFISNGSARMGADLGDIVSSEISGMWFTSPFCQIETAMAFQLGLPTLTLREKGVIAEGILLKGVTGMHLPEFELPNTIQKYLSSSEWRQTISQWEANVRKVNEKKGFPPQIY